MFFCQVMGREALENIVVTGKINCRRDRGSAREMVLDNLRKNITDGIDPELQRPRSVEGHRRLHHVARQTMMMMFFFVRSNALLVT